jgi:hypothetical protein
MDSAPSAIQLELVTSTVAGRDQVVGGLTRSTKPEPEPEDSGPWAGVQPRFAFNLRRKYVSLRTVV